MVRISDILKKARKDKDEAKRVSSEISQDGASLKDHSEKEEQMINPEDKKEQQEKITEIRISPSIIRMSTSEGSIKLYDEALSLITAILKEEKASEKIDIQVIFSQLEKMVDQLSLGNDNLLILAFTRDSKDLNYLFSHSVNVCIYTIELGQGLGFEKQKLLELGVCAFLHDVGMIPYINTVHQPRKLTPAEFEQIKNHTLLGSKELEKISSFSRLPSLVSYQHHERMDGSGYPASIKDNALNEFSKIISLVDVYEAMTHLRVYRDRHPTLETVQDVLNNKSKFDSKLVKILIDRIGVFPAGSFVKLSNKEIAQVIKISKGVPLRPQVKIIFDAEGNEPKEQKIIDLMQHPTIYIKSEVKMM